MMIEMDDVMVRESVLTALARKEQEASKNGVFENCVVDLPASGAMEVTGQVVEMETSPPAVTHSPVVDDMSKHGDGTQTESAQGEELVVPPKPSEGGMVSELPIGSSSFPSLDSGNVNDIVGKGTAVVQKERRNRGKNWKEAETDDLLEAVPNTPKVRTRMEQGTECDSYWDAVAKAVAGRTGDECRNRVDSLKRSFNTTKKYCDGHRKEFKELNEEDFSEMKASPRLTEAWYNRIRDYCPPIPKKKSKSDRAGSSSKSAGFVPGTSTLGLHPLVVPDGMIDEGEPAMAALPPGSQLELPVADPLLQQQQPPPPAPELWDGSFEELPSSFEDWLNNVLATTP